MLELIKLRLENLKKELKDLNGRMDREFQSSDVDYAKRAKLYAKIEILEELIR